MNGTTRNYAAACDAVTGALSPWDPDPYGSFGFMKALDANGNSTFLGGAVDYLDGAFGQDAENVVAVDPGNGLAQGDPEALVIGPTVLCLLANDTMLIAGGSFTTVGNHLRGGLAVYRLNDLPTITPVIAPSQGGENLAVWPSPGRTARFITPCATRPPLRYCRRNSWMVRVVLFPSPGSERRPVPVAN